MGTALTSRLRALVHAQPAAPRALAIQAAGILLLAGGLLALITVALPPPAEGSEPLIAVCGVVSAVAGGVLLVSRPYIPDHGLAVVALSGTALIAIASHEGGPSGGASSSNGILFLWVCLYCFYFLSLPQAFAQTAVAGVAYAWLLSGDPGTTSELATRWLVTMTSLAVAGLVIARLRGGVYRVVGELTQQASVDGLTGLLNRNSLLQRFEQERARAESSGTPISVLAVDIDDFKPLNDAMGHPAGDQVLRQVSAAVRHWTRRLDLAARLGGDELAVVLPGAGPEDARTVAEQIRSAIARDRGPKDVHVTVSIGVATADAPIPLFEDLWQAADAAMYVAKRSGGDQVRSQGETEREFVGRVTRWDPHPA